MLIYPKNILAPLLNKKKFTPEVEGCPTQRLGYSGVFLCFPGQQGVELKIDGPIRKIFKSQLVKSSISISKSEGGADSCAPCYIKYNFIRFVLENITLISPDHLKQI